MEPSPRNPFAERLAHPRDGGRGGRGGFRKIYPLVALAVALLLIVAVLPLLGPFNRLPASPEPQGEPRAASVPTDPAVLEQMRAARRARLGEEHGGALLDAPNATDFAETKGYRKLLATLLDHAPGEGPAARSPLLDHALALKAPELLQGERVRARGVLCDWWPVKLQESLWGRQDVFRGFLAAGDGTEWVAFDVLERPEGLTRARDAIEVEGIFYRTARYAVKEPGEGDGTRTVPYLLALRVRALSGAGSTGMQEGGQTVFLIVLCAACLWFGFRALQVFRRRRPAAGSRNPSAGFRGMFGSRLRAARSDGPGTSGSDSR